MITEVPLGGDGQDMDMNVRLCNIKDFLLELHEDIGCRINRQNKEEASKLKYRLIRAKRKCCICQDKIKESLN